MIVIDTKAAEKVNLGGRGGKEALLNKVFENTQRVNAELYDLKDPAGSLLELKKQEDQQWFDAGKYHDLSEANKQIEMVFILTSRGRKSDPAKKGMIEKIFTIKLGRLLEILTTTEKHQKCGWEWSNIEACYNQKQKYPTQQAKVTIKMRAFLKENKKDCTIIWQR